MFNISGVMKALVLAGSILALANAPCWAAQEEPVQDTGADNVFTLGEVELSAMRDSEKQAKVEKITAEEMRQFNADTVAEAVNLVPGAMMSTVGARNERMVYVRGFDLKHVPIFLDGIPIYVPYDGYPDLGRFTTFDLSEIVVSKGFSSVLYGPNTMGGAINMVSRKPGKPFEAQIGAGVGSGGLYKAHANIGMKRDAWYVQAGGSYVDSDYTRMSKDFEAVAAENGQRRENSYYRDEAGNLKIGYTPGDDEYALSFNRQHGVKGTPPYAGESSSQSVRYWQWPYWNKESVYLTTNTNFEIPLYLKTTAFYDRFWNSLFSFDDSTYSTITRRYAFRSNYNDHTYGASVELGTDALQDHLIKLALRYKNDIHKEWNEGSPIQTFQDYTVSAGLEDTVTLSPRMYLIAGLGYDVADTTTAEDLNDADELVDFEMDKTSAFSPQAGLFYTLPDQSVMHISVARKTRIPSIKDKYSYRLGTAIPNSGLDPEKSVNYEAGYEKLFWGRALFKTAVFHNAITDYILQETVADPADPGATVYQNRNIGKVTQYGAEASITASLHEMLEGGLNYAYIKQHNKTNDDELTDVPSVQAGGYLKFTPVDA